LVYNQRNFTFVTYNVTQVSIFTRCNAEYSRRHKHSVKS